jgi:hypothetical protein
MPVKYGYYCLRRRASLHLPCLAVLGRSLVPSISKKQKHFFASIKRFLQHQQLIKSTCHWMGQLVSDRLVKWPVAFKVL